MAATKYNLTVEQGSTFVKLFTLLDATTGVPRDLTNYFARGMIRNEYGDTVPLATFVIVMGGVLGTMHVNLTSVVTAGLSFDTAVYDIELVEIGTSPENVERILQGNVVLSLEVTK